MAKIAGDQIRRDRRIKWQSVLLALDYSLGGHDIAAICRDVNLCRFYFPEFEVLFQKRVRGFQQVSNCVWKPDETRSTSFEMTSPKKQYKIIQCRIFPFFFKCLVCVIFFIQSAFIVFVL